MDKDVIKNLIFLIVGTIILYLLIFEFNLMGWILFVIWYVLTSF